MDRIVFFDIDGTLLNEEKEVPESTQEAIWKLKKNGIHVAIATGRAPFMFQHLLEQLEIDNYVSFNGQYVLFDGEVIYKKPVPERLLKRLENEADQHGHPMVFMHQEGMTVNREGHPWVEESIGSLKVEQPKAIARGDEEIYQALLFCTENEEHPYVQQYEELKFIRWHPYSLDVLISGGSKADGIAEMIRRLDLKMDQVYAFGDASNDIEMLQTAGTGVAMGNASNEVKRAADIVTKDVAEDGIYYALKQLELIK